MDNPKSRHELEQEVINLQCSVKQEKLEKAEALLTHRLIFSAIIFVIIFLAICVAIEDKSSWVQWLCLIPFFGAVFSVAGRIFVHYKREKEEANR